MHGLGPEQQIVEWQGKQGLNLGEGPVVTKGVSARGDSIHTWLPIVISGILRRQLAWANTEAATRPAPESGCTQPSG
ncbi:hypothetical protein KAM338_11210 [Aeromonas caviae]|nr:hypothetical protein KAM330_30150 [Aeromonas hydrophila]GKQ60944.1 hypothetical protein KAM338_11210 [Aeromonas caviae]